MRKISNFCGIFATLFVTTTMVLLVSCSQDDDYYDSDMYTLAEMGTRLGGKGDPGNGIQPDYGGYYTDPDNCGGVALAILYGIKNTTDPKYVYAEVKDSAGGSCTGMSHEKVCSVGMKLGLYCNQYQFVGGTNVDSIVTVLGNINGKIIFVDVNGGPLNHAIIGHNITKKVKVTSAGDTITQIKITGEDRSGNVTYTADKIVGIIK